MDGRLPLTLRSRECEPCHAAGARLASRWGAANVLRFARTLGHPLPDLVRGAGVRSFADKAGLDADTVEAHSPLVDAATRTVRLRDQVLRLGDWSVRSRRHCPICVDEDRSEALGIGIEPEWWATSRPWWDVRSVDVCPRHGVRMTDRCGACGAVQSWRHWLLRCGCGAEHGSQGAVEGDAAVASYILSRLSFADATAVPALDGMELVDAIRTMELLGAARLERRAVKPRRSEEDLPEDRRIGLSMASGWPAKFTDLLDTLVASRAASAPDGLMSAYGWLYSELCVGDAPPAVAELVAPVLREHAVAKGVIARDEERLGANVPETVSATEVARRIGRSYATTRRLLNEREAVPEGSRRGVAFAIDPTTIDALDRPRTTPPSKRLRIGRRQARTLLSDPRLTDAVEGERPSAEGLLDAVLSRATLPAARGLVPLPVACRNMSLPLAAACDGILAGKVGIARCGTVDDGLLGAMVRQSDLAVLREPEVMLGIESVARLGGIHHEAALQLARAGAFGPRAEGRVGRDSVTRFFAEHVAAAELARARGTSSTALSRTLSMLGVEPRFGPPTCRQLIYLRADIPALH